MKVRLAVFHESVHLDGEQLEPPGSMCPFCGSTNRRAVYLLQRDPEVSLLRCADCHADSASRMPTDEALAACYRGYYSSPGLREQDERVTFGAVARFGRHLASILLRYRRYGRLSVLDFGGGDGSLSHALAVALLRRGVGSVDITVIDYDDATLDPEDGRISITKEGALEGVRSRFDVVIASAVIEHLPRPREILDGLLDRLKPGGVFYARTPYMVPLMSQLSRLGMRPEFTFPTHVHDLGQAFWESYFTRVLSADDYRILRSRPSIVETSFGDHFLKTLAAYVLKAPWYLIGRSYPFVGGWEVFVQKNPGQTPAAGEGQAVYS